MPRKHSRPSTNLEASEVSKQAVQAKQLKHEWGLVSRRLTNLEKRSNTSTHKMQNHIKVLNQDVKSLIARQKKFFTLPSVVKNLTKEVKKLENREKKLNSRIEKLESKIQQLEKKNEKLEENNENLKSRVEQLQKTEQSIASGQVMTEFEKNLAEFVIPRSARENKRIGLTGCRTYLNHWFKDPKHKKDVIKERRQIYDLLLKPMDEKHWDVMKEVKEHRNTIAHPGKINLKEAVKHINATFPQWEKECSVIFKVFEKINCLLQLGRFAHIFKTIVNTSHKPTQVNGKKMMHNNSSGKKAKLLNWNTLSKKGEWTSNHRCALKEMTKLYRPDSIPYEIDFDKIDPKKHIVGFVPEDLEQECFDIIDVIKQVGRKKFVNCPFDNVDE